MSTPEGKVKDMIRVEMLVAFPFCYRFMPVQNGMGAPGLDFYYCVHGRFIAIEAKALGKSPTARQYDTIKEIKEAGGTTWVIDSREAFRYAANVWRNLGLTQMNFDCSVDPWHPL